MKVGILGTGVVGQTIGAKLAGLGQAVVMGTRDVAKARVTELLKAWFGWKHVLDLGDITTARGAEMWLPLWLRLFGALQTPYYNIKVAT